MKKGLSEIVFILDRSGSMGGLEADTIGGFNGMLNKQKKEAGEAVVTTVLFDDKIERLHDRVDLGALEPMTEEQYYVRGCTALLDAIGETIKYINKVHKSLPDEERPESTIFIITTDGMENASRNYNYAKVKQMIEKRQKKNNWEFLFLGANIDAISEAARFGINKDKATNFICDKQGTAVNFKAMSKAVSAVRCAMPLNAAWKEEIEMDYEERCAK